MNGRAGAGRAECLRGTFARRAAAGGSWREAHGARRRPVGVYARASWRTVTGGRKRTGEPRTLKARLHSRMHFSVSSDTEVGYFRPEPQVFRPPAAIDVHAELQPRAPLQRSARALRAAAGEDSFVALARRAFDAIDRDGDGAISRADIGACLRSKVPSAAGASAADVDAAMAARRRSDDVVVVGGWGRTGRGRAGCVHGSAAGWTPGPRGLCCHRGPRRGCPRA